MSFSEVLRELRKKEGYTQKEVADHLNLTRASYGHYETGHVEPSTVIIQKLADFFSVSVDLLLGRETKIDTQKNKEVVLSEKEMQEIKRKAEGIKGAMMSAVGLAFDGKPKDEETLRVVIAALEEGMVLAKKEAKEKYTPKKYRK